MKNSKQKLLDDISKLNEKASKTGQEKFRAESAALLTKYNKMKNG
jgi:hypothetical protein